MRTKTFLKLEFYTHVVVQEVEDSFIDHKKNTENFFLKKRRPYSEVVLNNSDYKRVVDGTILGKRVRLITIFVLESEDFKITMREKGIKIYKARLGVEHKKWLGQGKYHEYLVEENKRLLDKLDTETGKTMALQEAFIDVKDKIMVLKMAKYDGAEQIFDEQVDQAKYVRVDLQKEKQEGKSHTLSTLIQDIESPFKNAVEKRWKTEEIPVIKPVEVFETIDKLIEPDLFFLVTQREREKEDKEVVKRRKKKRWDFLSRIKFWGRTSPKEEQAIS